jgi:hypothetical protein
MQRQIVVNIQDVKKINRLLKKGYEVGQMLGNNLIVLDLIQNRRNLFGSLYGNTISSGFGEESNVGVEVGGV